MGPLLQRPLIEDGTLLNQVGLQGQPETILDDILIRHCHLGVTLGMDLRETQAGGDFADVCCVYITGHIATKQLDVVYCVLPRLPLKCLSVHLCHTDMSAQLITKHLSMLQSWCAFKSCHLAYLLLFTLNRKWHVIGWCVIAIEAPNKVGIKIKPAWLCLVLNHSCHT